MESVASARSKSIESEASVASAQGKGYTTPTFDDQPTTTATTTVAYYSNDKPDTAPIVGGVVGGVLGAAVLGLICVLLWRRKNGAPPSPSTGQQLVFGQQHSSQPVTPASAAFSTNTNYIGGPPVTYAAQSGWQQDRLTPLALPEGAGSAAAVYGLPAAAGRAAPGSQGHDSPPPPVTAWIERSPITHQENHGDPSSQSHTSPLSEGSIGPRELHDGAIRGSTYSAIAPSDTSSAPWASGIVASAVPSSSRV
jgi:hypothetical protein